MSSLTKVFIVVLSVLAIVFSVLVIQYTAITENYRATVDNARAAASQFRESLEAERTRSKAALTACEQIIQKKDQQIAELAEKMQTTAVELAKVGNDLLAQTQTNAALVGQVTQFQGILAAGDTERKDLQSQLADLRKEFAAAQSENFNLAKTNQDLQLQRQLFEKEMRLLKEQNVSLEKTAEQLRYKMRAEPGQESTTTAPAPGPMAQAGLVGEAGTARIAGQITQVRDALASISVGAAQGVEKGMELIVYRGGQYLGKLRVTEVQPDESVGELKQVQGLIRQGDSVTDKF